MAVAAAAVSRVKVAQPGTMFGVFAIAGLIALCVLLKQGQIPEGTFLALLLFLLIGALAPPVAIIIGVIILVYLIYTGAGQALVTWSNGLLQSKWGQGPQFTGPYAPLGPSVPGAQQTSPSGPYAPLGPTVP